MTIDEAVTSLTNAGLVVEKLGGLEQRILGGTARLDQDGAEAYKGAFSIGRSSSGWELVTSDTGKPEQRPTLEAIIALVREKLT